MGRNYGVEKQDEIYHNPETFTAGFWAEAVVVSVLWGIVTILGLLLIGILG